MASGSGVGWSAEVCFVSYRAAFSLFTVDFTMEDFTVLISILTDYLYSLFHCIVYHNS